MTRVWPCAARGGPATARHAHRRSGVRRRVLDALLLRLPRAAARARDRPGLAQGAAPLPASDNSSSPGSASAGRLLRALAVSAGRAADGAGGTSPPTARSSSTAPSRPARSRLRCGTSRCCGATRWAGRLRCSQSSAWCGCWRRLPRARSLLLAFPLPFLLFIANTAPASRYLNPVLPFLAIFAAWAAVAPGARAAAYAAVFWGRRRRSPRSPAWCASIDVRPLLPPGRHADAGRALHRGPCPPGATILTQPYSAVADAVARRAGRGADAEPRQRRGGLDEVPAAARARSLPVSGLSADLSGPRRPRCRQDLRGSGRRSAATPGSSR